MTIIGSGKFETSITKNFTRWPSYANQGSEKDTKYVFLNLDLNCTAIKINHFRRKISLSSFGCIPGSYSPNIQVGDIWISTTK